MAGMAGNDEVLFLEPFYGGSHKQLIDTLMEGRADTCLHTLPATKWHWRARTSALHFAQTVPKVHKFRVLFASSVLNLSELMSLRPDLAALHKVVYFHENQLVYPVRKHQERDFQYGYNQILTCLVADKVVFNSHYNMESFLGSISTFFKLQPDHRPKGLEEQIRPKCSVLYFPLQFPPCINRVATDKPLHIVWPHRWEHDKDPDTFFSVLDTLTQYGLDFRVSILGQSYNCMPEVFESARNNLGHKLVHFGHLPCREDYYTALRDADVVVSTAIHEFYGVAMIEASYCGCYPLCPNRLAYPEIFPPECLYNTTAQLVKSLASFCKKPYLAHHKWNKLGLEFEKYSWDSLKSSYNALLK